MTSATTKQQAAKLTFFGNSIADSDINSPSDSISLYTPSIATQYKDAVHLYPSHFQSSDQHKEEKNDERPTHHRKKSTAQLITDINTDQDTITDAVTGLLNRMSLTFYDSILENAFSITMFVRRGHDSQFALAMTFFVHIIFAAFYGQIRENMIATVISWSISAALFIAGVSIKIPAFILQSLGEIEKKEDVIFVAFDDKVKEKNIRNGAGKDGNAVDTSAEIVKQCTDVDSVVDVEVEAGNVTIPVSYSTLFALMLFNYIVYFSIVRIFYNGISYAQLAILLLFQLQFVHTFGYLRFVHFISVSIASIVMFAIMRIIAMLAEISVHLDIEKSSDFGDVILCFLLVFAGVCMTGKYLYHYELYERALFHTFATADTYETNTEENDEITDIELIIIGDDSKNKIV